jgi:hypothetical protein
MVDILLESAGTEYPLSVEYPGYLSNGGLSREGRIYIEGVIDRMPQAIVFAADKLLSIYNDAWIDDDHPKLSIEQFKSKLKLKCISVIDEPNCATLYFEDGDMFGGHHVALDIQGFEATYASIIG